MKTLNEKRQDNEDNILITEVVLYFSYIFLLYYAIRNDHRLLRQAPCCAPTSDSDNVCCY